MRVPPKANEFEVTVFGPGYGESIVVHVGDGQWMVVDSFSRGPKAPPFVLQYFDLINVDPTNEVKLVLVTHWHDDHIRGVSELIDRCPTADICISQAFTKKEFMKFLAAYSTNSMSQLGSGVNELEAVLLRMNQSGRTPHRGAQDKRIIYREGADFSHGCTCEVWTLSPSDFQVMQSEARFSDLLPEAGTTMRRAVPGKENNHSVAVWISVGQINVILGADLETTSDARAGWDSVVGSRSRPKGKVSLFKVPHHGSQTGHHDGLWARVLEPDVNAVVTPWNRGSGLPSHNDIVRLNAPDEEPSSDFCAEGLGTSSPRSCDSSHDEEIRH